MADDRSTSFPFAGLAVVALFLGTTFLAPQGFELLRQAETDRPSARSGSSRRSMPACGKTRWRRWRAIAGAAPTPRRRSRGEESRLSAAGGRQWPQGSFRGDTDWVTIAATLPGAVQLGAEEARRRTRYAVLAGLNAEGYIPDDASTCA